MNEHIVNLSGGKDSTAMLLLMLERGIRVDRIIFADVGENAERPEMYEYIDKVEQFIHRPIERIKSEKWTWDKLFFQKYTSKSKHVGKIHGFRYCPTTGQMCGYREPLKTRPLKRAGGSDNVIYIGIAIDEAHRAVRKLYKNTKNQYRFPLIRFKMTEADCIKYLKERDLHNPLYGIYSRLGCIACGKQSMQSLRVTYKHRPHEWQMLEYYQASCDWPMRPEGTVQELGKIFQQE